MLCFFCEKPEEEKKKLHKVQTFRLDAKVRKAAIDTDNTILYAKLQNGDMCAQDAVYHTDCLCQLYRDAQQSRIGSDANENDRRMHGPAFSNLISFIDATAQSAEADTIPLFKLADLTRHYSDSLEKYGIKDY